MVKVGIALEHCADVLVVYLIASDRPHGEASNAVPHVFESYAAAHDAAPVALAFCCTVRRSSS